MTNQVFEDLLARMPEIAEAVNGFTAEAIQEQVLKALISAFFEERAPGTGASEESAKPDAPGNDKPTDPPTGRAQRPIKTTSTRKTSSVKQSFSLVKNLDFEGGAEVSFGNFSAEKAPRNNPEKALVALYWLSRMANISPVTVEHIYTAFRAAEWAVPTNLINNLHQAGTKGWIDSKKRDDLTIVVGGENYLLHKMPAKAK